MTSAVQQMVGTWQLARELHRDLQELGSISVCLDGSDALDGWQLADGERQLDGNTLQRLTVEHVRVVRLVLPLACSDKKRL